MENTKSKHTSLIITIEEIPKLSFRILLFLIPTVVIPFFILHESGLREQISILGDVIDDSFFAFVFRLMLVATVFLICVILGIVLHEAIHALFFSLFLPSRFIGVKFGFDEQHGIPFVHIKEPISVLGFRVGAIMPLILLGIIPVVLGMYYGSLGLTAFGALFTISASGDLLLIARTKGISSDQRLKDLPDKIGFEVV